MCGMLSAMLLSVVVLLGFAYIIWVLASKESGSTRLTGQVLAILLVILVLLMMIYGGYKKDRLMGKHRMKDRCDLCGQGHGKMMKIGPAACPMLKK